MKVYTSAWGSRSVYLLLLISTLTHLTSGQQSGVLMVGFGALLCTSPFIPTKFVEKRIWLLTLNALTLGYLLFGMAQLVIIKVSPMQLASSFLLVLMANKLLGPRRARDRMQLVLLSLLQMVIASALTSGLKLGFFLVIYTIFLPITLTLLTLARDHEIHDVVHHPPLSSAPADRGLPPRLLTILIATGFAVLFGAILFFVLIPRLGFGLFAPNNQGQSMTGFSSRVNLGDFGRIRTNKTTVMRVRVSGTEPSRSKKNYWRGISLDRYEDGRWSKTFDRKKEIRLTSTGFVNFERFSGANTAQEIFLEPLSEPVLFGLSEVRSLSRCPGAQAQKSKIRFFRDVVGDLYYETPRKQTLRYCVKSQQTRATPAARAVTFSEYTEHKKALSKTFQRTYFQVPDEIKPTLNTVLERIQFDSDLVMNAVQSIETHLEKNYRYTLDRKSDTTVQPITDFLLKQPEGHCEYFATALVLLLRQKGIAARLVNGFAGGRRNEFGEYMVIHQGNAHSWVEVFVPTKRCKSETDCSLVGSWLTFDPTPSQETMPEAKSMLRDLIDALQLRWAEYVVRYNLRTQISWMSAIFNWVSPSESGTASTSKNRVTKSEEKPRTKKRWLAFGFGLFLLSLFIWFFLKNRRPQPNLERAALEVTQLFESVVQEFEKYGLSRANNQTAREWLSCVQKTDYHSAELAQFVQCYEESRFQPGAPNLEELRRLRNLIPMNEPSNQ